MKFKTQPPTSPGWYWIYDKTASLIKPVYVYPSQDKFWDWGRECWIHQWQDKIEWGDELETPTISR